jgi:phospholipid/cholesterol/gamma-HCH transport system substrate-binding protein
VLSDTVVQSFLPSRIIEGTVTPDPSNTLATASKVLENAGATLDSIQQAATGIAKLSESSDQLRGFISTWDTTGKKLGALADDVKVVVADNKNELGPAIRSLRQAAEKVDATLDEPTRANLQKSLAQLEDGTRRLDQILSEVQPLTADLGSPATAAKTTQLGQLIGRIDRIAFQLGLLTAGLTDPSGNRLNPDGTLQRMILRADLYDNLNQTAAGLRETVDSVRPLVRNLTTFSERIARDPAALGRGVLDR